MKKLMMLFFALVAMATVEAQNVYIATSNSAIAYHKSKTCSYLKNSANVKAVSTTEAKNMGRHACVRCYPEQKEQTMKAIAKEKKTTTTKKATTTAKKTTTATTKKATPERDEKGRFVKKSTTTETTAKKATPERDEKGRFVKKSTTTDTKTKTTTKKTTKKAA
jgi:hypothetical protein